jgi:fluoride exporter
MSIQSFFLVGLGGFFGSIARYYLVKAVDGSINRIIPYGTLTVNIIGSFLLGIIYALALKKSDSSETIRLLLGTGFCGGFTTFSAFAWENLQLFSQKNTAEALTYILISLIVGFLAVWAGFSLTKAL